MSIGKIIILSGKKQSGKDTAADHLIDRHGGVKFSFADPLKRFLIKVFSLSYEQCYGTDAEKNSLTKIQWKNLPLPISTLNDLWLNTRIDKFDENCFLTARELMQVFGSDICRTMYPDCWLEATEKDVYEYVSESVQNTAIITDARFPNEINQFLKYNPLIIRLKRDIYKPKHKSENALNNYDWDIIKAYVIDNSNLSLEQKNFSIDLVYNDFYGNF